MSDIRRLYSNVIVLLGIQVENGDLNWIVPNKLMAFSGPSARRLEVLAIQNSPPLTSLVFPSGQSIVKWMQFSSVPYILVTQTYINRNKS